MERIQTKQWYLLYLDYKQQQKLSAPEEKLCLETLVWRFLIRRSVFMLCVLLSVASGQVLQFKLSDIGEGIIEVTVKEWCVSRWSVHVVEELSQLLSQSPNHFTWLIYIWLKYFPWLSLPVVTSPPVLAYHQISVKTLNQLLRNFFFFFFAFCWKVCEGGR